MIHPTQKGFTLIEMLVVLAIFGVVSATVLFNHSKFRSTTILTNTTYELALSIREAQIYGVSVRDFDGTSVSASFDKPYGIYIPDNSNQYLLFADDDNDRKYDGTSCTNQGDDTCIAPYTLQGQIRITSIDKYNSSSGNCPPGQKLDNVSVLFRRPNPEPIIDGQIDSDPIQITVSLDDLNRYVVVSSNGQISVVNESICK